MIQNKIVGLDTPRGYHAPAAVLGGVLRGKACAETAQGAFRGKVTYTFALDATQPTGQYKTGK
ncbi:MAG: hypothetical protein HYZ21_10610 [Chloroflexi bacterium]|nr:hypothetical protein [Chloroflexota bacterium]